MDPPAENLSAFCGWDMEYFGEGVDGDDCLKGRSLDFNVCVSNGCNVLARETARAVVRGKVYCQVVCSMLMAGVIASSEPMPRRNLILGDKKKGG